jgi:hypothetical protein
MEDTEMVEQQVRAAALADDPDAAAVAAQLEPLPAQEARRILDAVVSELGARAVPLLGALALQGPVQLAVLSLDALGSVRDEAAAAALRRVSAEAAAGGVRKAARRALHRLASRGVRPPALETKAASTPRRGGNATVFGSYASFIDGAGHRAIWMALEDGGDLDLMTFLISETSGIVDARAFETDKASFRGEAERVTRDETFPWAEMPPDYCRHLLEEAHARNAAKRAPIPLDYLAWRDRIGRPEEHYDQPLVYRFINAAEVRWDPRYLDSSAALMEMRPFQSWILDGDEIAEVTRERGIAKRSGLVLAGADEESSDRMLVESAIQRLFDPARRSIYRRRLEEAAYLLWRLERGFQARQALAAAMALEPADRSLSNHPFVRQVVMWSLEMATRTAEEERTREVRPGVQLYLP